MSIAYCKSQSATRRAPSAEAVFVLSVFTSVRNDYCPLLSVTGRYWPVVERQVCRLLPHELPRRRERDVRAEDHAVALQLDGPDRSCDHAWRMGSAVHRGEVHGVDVHHVCGLERSSALALR